MAALPLTCLREPHLRGIPRMPEGALALPPLQVKAALEGHTTQSVIERERGITWLRNRWENRT